MLILTLDTSTEYAVLAVGDEFATLLAANVYEHDRHLSQTLYANIAIVLETARVGFDDIDVLGVGVGPGSFTGVRTAVTTMRTLAQASQKKLVSIGTLLTYAIAASDLGYHHTAVVLPSRKNEVYFQEFNNLEPLSGPTVSNYSDLLANLSTNGTLVLTGQTGVLPNAFSDFRSFPQKEPPPSCALHEAARKVRSGDFDDPYSLAPAYAAPPAISQHKHR